ncbi:hypothetical protein [Burkholderia ambifaria]|uniref:hypothetical protein n=1 Tax=Burkholderia ambifaria TaxID=152480 RepID=UPI00158A112C|nr:hypothetical protein [Burkholderia ambifaria]
MQNNAGAGGAWHFRSSITLETVDRVTHDIDLLHVSSIDGAWDEFKDEFQRLGLITIVSLPGQD